MIKNMKLVNIHARFGRMAITDISKAMGMSPMNLSLLDRNLRDGIDFDTLSKLCEVLNCQPGDLLTFLPGLQGDIKPERRTRKRSSESDERIGEI